MSRTIGKSSDVFLRTRNQHGSVQRAVDNVKYALLFEVNAVVINCNVVEAHCYALQCRRIGCEQLRYSINQQLIAGRFGHKALCQLCMLTLNSPT